MYTPNGYMCSGAHRSIGTKNTREGSEYPESASYGERSLDTAELVMFKHNVIVHKSTDYEKGKWLLNSWIKNSWGQQ